MKTFIESQLNSLYNRCIRQLKTKILSKILTRELRLCFDHSQILKSPLWKVGGWNYSSKGYSCINIRHIFSVKWKIIYIKVIIRDWHCVKSVHIRGFSGPSFPVFGLKYGEILRLLVFSPNAGKCGSEKLRIRIIFKQCECMRIIIYCLTKVLSSEAATRAVP